jgi:DNA-binding response OmpR family regulator
MPVSPSHILSIASTDSVRTTRELLLREQGFMVVSASTLREISHVCRRSKFDLIVVGHGFEEKAKLAIAEVLRKDAPGTAILEICRVSPVLTHAQHVLRSPEPEDLISEIKTILQNQ